MMEKKSLYIYKLDEQGNKVKFPNSDMPAKLGEYTYSAQRMAGTPTLTATLNYPSCLDDFWTGEEFVEFRGEKYYVDQVPTSSKGNKSIMYKHELQFVSERIVLENVYFMDVFTTGADTYHSNSTSVKFMGDIHEFVGRLNASMAKSGIGYSVVIDDDITSDSKLVSLDNVYLADALQSIYTIYELPYYFVGKVCHIGYTENVISTPFEYRKGLVSIKKTNANYKIVNRVTGVGSSDNIPFYYPNDDETGTIERSQNLMPSIYRQTSGAERFYNALNNTYKIPGTNDYYSFKNTYSAKKVKEIKVDFSDIKPTIEGVTNASGQLFGEIADIAFDENDSDELGTGEGNNVFNGTDEYVHSYFYIKLHIYNGDYGFNLFEQGLEGGNAVINMTTGNCAACEFGIGVTYKEGETRAYNPVLLGPTGNLIPGDFEQKVTSDTSQYVSSQQDTSKNSVWIAVKKDNSSFGVVMPNATNNYRPSVGDKFVITGIKMPKPLVLAAEKRLEEALIKYMSENNDEKFTFSVNFSRVFLAENTYLWDILNENARIYIKYNNREYLMYVNSYTCKADKNCLYDISVELTDKLSANVSALRSTITEIAGDIIGEKIGSGGNVSTSDILSKVSRHFISKRHDDRTDYLVSFNKGINIGAYKKPLYDIIRSTDNSVIPSDESVYSSLAMDARYISKYKTDSTQYPVDFTSGLSINSKRIGDVIRYYDAPKPVATDANIYSALQTDQRIEEEFRKIDDRYIRKDKEDVAHKEITFEEGITVYELSKLMNLDVKQLATIAQAVCAVVRSSKFVDGFAGEGYQIWQDIASGDWCMTLDRLTVRKVLTIYELVVAKIRSVGGMIVVSAANGIIKSAERIGEQYVLEFDDVNQFVPGDLMRCQVFSPSGLKYYWVRVSAVNGEKVYVPASEFAGVEPVKGDEVVLMGNTDNPLRQNLLLISATEDGQPRFDCLDGVKTKSLEGCLKVRVGALDGISDSRFPADMQPSGYGIYGNNCFLTGVFVLSNGKDVMTMFSIMEGMLKSEISSVRNEINAKDNYLKNSSFSDNLLHWIGSSNIRIFSVSGKLLYFNNNFYSNKQNFANISSDGTKNVLRLKNSSITQLNADFARHPEFDLYDITSTDEEGNEIVTGQQYRARMFYVSFRYKVTRPGTLRVYFKNENQEGFEEYVPVDYTEVLNPTDGFQLMEISGKWNGTGDFYLSFSGDMYIYSLALSDNRLADVEEKFNSRFEMTDKKIQANLDEIKKTGTKLEEYHSEFLLTARNLQIQFTEDLSDAENRITEAYKSYVNITARDLTVQFSADLSDSENRITESYTSAIELSARGLRADFTADLTDMEIGITSAYKSYVNLTAHNLQAGFTEDLTDLRTGVTEAYTSAIDLSARGLRTEFNSSITDINGKLTQHTSSFHVTAAKIEAMVSATDNISNTIRTAGWITTADGNKLWAAQVDLKLEADNARILAAASSGKSLYDNPTFAEVSGNAIKSRNNISVYNNAGGSAVSITRKNISGVPNDTGFGLEISTAASGSVTPGWGGFFFGTGTGINRMLVCKFIAKIPAGYTVEFATNATGDGGTKKWLTAHSGTGKWEEYAYYVRCGSSGSFSSTFFFYLNGGSRPVTWQLASANVYELSVQDLSSKYSQIKQTVDSIRFEVYEKGGKFSVLEQTVNTISTLIGDGAEGNFSQIIQRLNEIQLKVNKITLDDEGNVTNISKTGITTDENGDYLFATKAEYNSQGTQISTMQSNLNVTAGKVNAIAARFDANGHLIEGAGWVTTTAANSLWVKKNGVISAINQTAESVTIDASKINLNGAITANGSFKIKLDGSMETTAGKIAGFTIIGNGLTNEPFTNDAYVIFRNDAHKCFAGIGGNVLPASTGLRGVARFENNDTSDQWGLGRNISVLLSAKGGAYNHAFLGTGNGTLDGWIGGYRYSNFSLSAANTIYDGYSNLKDNNKWVIYSSVSNAGITLPKLTEVRNALGISSGTKFCVEFTLIADINTSAFFVYGRNNNKDSGGKYPWNTTELPVLTHWNNGRWDSLTMAAGDALTVMLIYDPSKTGTMDGYSLYYTARIINRQD